MIRFGTLLTRKSKMAAMAIFNKNMITFGNKQAIIEEISYAQCRGARPRRFERNVYFLALSPF